MTHNPNNAHILYEKKTNKLENKYKMPLRWKQWTRDSLGLVRRRDQSDKDEEEAVSSILERETAEGVVRQAERALFCFLGGIY